MTLDTAKFISNSIKTQAKIQHLDINTKTTSTKEIPESVKKIITSTYGEKYLLDADYVSFFWGAIEKDDIEKLFNVVDKALGKSANKLTDKDFKKISIDGSEEIEVDDEVDSIEDDEIDDADEESSEEETDDAEEEIDDDNELNEDEEEIEQETIATTKTSYFFLKITLK